MEEIKSIVLDLMKWRDAWYWYESKVFNMRICVNIHYVNLSQYYKVEEQVAVKSTNEMYPLSDALGYNTYLQ